MESATSNEIPGGVRLALIATYAGLSEIFSRVAEREGLKPHIAFASLEEAASIAREIEHDNDVILSRGGSAEYVRRAVDIPVVSIPITSFDALRAVHVAKESADEIAFFNFRQNMYGIKYIEKIFGVKIYEYTFVNEQEIEDGIRDAMSRGVKVAIGGIIAVRVAQELGLKGVLIECGEEAVDLSIREAIHLAQVRMAERNRAARIKGVLDAIAEGIIVTDEQNSVTMYNPAAERIFRIPPDRVMGQQVQKVIPNTKMHKVFETGLSEMAVLQEIGGGTIATNRIPIVLDGKRIGVVSTFENVTKIQQLEEQIRKKLYAKGFTAKNSFTDIISSDADMEELKELAALYATKDSAVLIQGESGTGKELFAQSIHNASRRSSGPFVAVNCAAMPEHLLESELFGYEGGAFTGAKKEGKQGLFELAHRGTIFLDEIGDIPQSLQARLLRVLQEKEIMRVGGDKIVSVDIRIISATNKALELKVKQVGFRDDLYYRLNVFNLKIPPLRDRKSDILLLARNFLSRMDAALELDAAAPAMTQLLLNYDWPGNVRELHNVMERLALLASQPGSALRWEKMLHQAMLAPAANESLFNVRVDLGKGLKCALDQTEKSLIEIMMARHDQNQDIVAKKLGIGRTTLWRKSRS
jgi:PAS domain S-box-containing protein